MKKPNGPNTQRNPKRFEPDPYGDAQRVGQSRESEDIQEELSRAIPRIQNIEGRAFYATMYLRGAKIY